MKATGSKRQRHLFMVVGAVFFVLFAANKVVNSGMKNYNELLDADVMNVYDEASLVCSLSNVPDILDTYHGVVGVGVFDITLLDLKSSDLMKRYTLEFLENDKVISSIAVFALEDCGEKGEGSVKDYFRKFNGEYVVLYEKNCYFVFGQSFFDRMSEFFT